MGLDILRPIFHFLNITNTQILTTACYRDRLTKLDLPENGMAEEA
jgi:hypothetical protein